MQTTVAVAYDHDGQVMREWIPYWRKGEMGSTHWMRDNADKIAEIKIERKAMTFEVW